MAEHCSAIDALKLQVQSVRLAAESQRICRAGVEAMLAAGGTNIRTDAFLGANAMVLAHAVRVLVAAGASREKAMEILVAQARSALAAGFGPWTDGEGAVR